MDFPSGRSPKREASRQWAQRGHGDSGPELGTVFVAGGALPAGPATAAPRVGRASRRVVGTVFWAVVAFGTAGSVVAVREALFPEVGDATTRSVWQNPGVPASSLTDDRPFEPAIGDDTRGPLVAVTSSTDPLVTTTVDSLPSSTDGQGGVLPGGSRTNQAGSAPTTDDDAEAGEPSGTTGNEGPPTTADDNGGNSGSGGNGSGSGNSGPGDSGSGDSGSGSGSSGSGSGGSGSSGTGSDGSGSGSGGSGSGGSGSDDSGSEPDEPDEPDDRESVSSGSGSGDSDEPDDAESGSD